MNVSESTYLKDDSYGNLYSLLYYFEEYIIPRHGQPDYDSSFTYLNIPYNPLKLRKGSVILKADGDGKRDVCLIIVIPVTVIINTGNILKISNYTNRTSETEAVNDVLIRNVDTFPATKMNVNVAKEGAKGINDSVERKTKMVNKITD